MLVDTVLLISLYFPESFTQTEYKSHNQKKYLS